MQSMARITPVGGLAFTHDRQELYVRVEEGWQIIELGPILPLPPVPVTTLPGPVTLPTPTPGVIEGDNMLHLYASNYPVAGFQNGPGSMGGIRGADFICFKQAQQAGLKGTYRAFLSSKVQDIKSVVRKEDRNIPVVNAKNELMFSTWNDIFKGSEAPFNDEVPLYSFSGKDVMTDPLWPHKYVWHGSYSNGERMLNSYCDQWLAERTEEVGQASSLMNHRLLGQEAYGCNNSFVLLCIQNTVTKVKKK